MAGGLQYIPQLMLKSVDIVERTVSMWWYRWVPYAEIMLCRRDSNAAKLDFNTLPE